MAEIVTGLVLKSEQDKEWLKARFQVMANILEESWVYKEIHQSGEQQGLEKGIKLEKEQDILRFVELRFSSLLAQAKQTIERQLSFQQLQALQDRLYLATTIDEVRAALQEA